MATTLDPRHYRVDPDVSRAETLPAAAFTEAEFLAHELETVFTDRWLLLPPAPGALDAPDDTVPLGFLDRPLVLRRSGAGLRVLPNVCTHAWHTLVQAPGRAKTLTCPQHGRTFDGDGRCLAQKGFDPVRVPGFPRACDHLQGLPCAEWGPLRFARFPGGERGRLLGQPTTSLEEWLAPVKASLGDLDLSRLVERPLGDDAVREVEGNWKLHAWNYMDTFHIPYIHRAPGGLADAIDLASYRTELFPDAALQWAWARDPRDGFDPEQVAPRFRDPTRRVFALWWFLFPNVTLNFYPWGLSVNCWEPIPGRPDRTRFHWAHHVLDEAKWRERDQRWLSAKVDAEDVAALAQVRRGAASGFAPRGRFAPGSEDGPHWFHRRVSVTAFPER